MKKVYITNGSAENGKDTFAEFLGKYISVYKYSSIDLVKEMFEVVGISKNDKTEKKRKLWSDGKDLLTRYDDIPFKDITSIVTDFKNNKIEGEVLLIDIREPEEITRAVEAFGAETILVRKPNTKKIESNHADANVENYEYDYIIENNGSLEQLDYVAHKFVDEVINCKERLFGSSHIIYNPTTKKVTTVFTANKMLRRSV